MTKVILCGYREWAKDIFKQISSHPKISIIDEIYSLEDYNNKVVTFPADLNLILFIGWSWIIPKEITDKYLCLGIHPSDLPNYRGGSPLQHQIINGIEKSKVSLMTLSSKKLDAGEIWAQEDLDLSGDNMNNVFNNVVESSIKMLNRFFDRFPDVTSVEQDLSSGSYYKRRNSSESKLTLEQFNTMNLKDLYNFIRCLTDPYPNAFLEDKHGNKLYFKEIHYVAND